MQLSIELLVFAVFAIITLVGGVGVVLARNLFRAALMLLVSLFGVAGLFVLLSAPFLAAVQVLVYMGAIAILIIFAVMLTRGMVTVRRTMNEQWGLAAIIAVALFGVLMVVVARIPPMESASAQDEIQTQETVDEVAAAPDEQAIEEAAAEATPSAEATGEAVEPTAEATPTVAEEEPAGEDPTAQLGEALLDPRQFLLPFEVAAILLAGVLSGAIYIARDDEPNEPRA